jgi:hypothetical protein
MTWRDKFRPAIAEVIARHAAPEGERGRKLLAAALRERWRDMTLESYERHGYPYKIWLDEIAVQTGKRAKRDRPRRRIAARKLRSITVAEAREWLRKRQLKLFEERS